MTLDELFKDLSFGPLSNIALLGEGSGVIPETSYPRLLSLVNSALTALYGRFRLSQKTILLEAIADTSLYYLRPEHAFSSGIPGHAKYIRDTVGDPFLGNILRIERVTDSAGVGFNLNDRTAFSDTVFVPSFDCVQLVRPMVGYQYVIEYRANHAKFELDTDDLDQEVRLPAPFWSAFMAHIAGHLYQSLNGQENSIKGQEFLAQFERLCQEQEGHNTDVAAQSNTNERARINGWA